MRSARMWRVAAVGAAVVIAGGRLALWQTGQLAPLLPDEAQERAMMPAIDAYLDSPAYRRNNLGDYSPADYRSGRLKWVCDAAIVEVRPDGAHWRVGMDVACGDYSRDGTTVDQLDSGDMGDAVMVLSGGRRYQVLSAALEPGEDADPSWVRQHFSFLAAAEINSHQGPTAPIPDNLALSAFGCAPGATGTTQMLGQTYVTAFPCRPA